MNARADPSHMQSVHAPRLLFQMSLVAVEKRNSDCFYTTKFGSVDPLNFVSKDIESCIMSSSSSQRGHSFCENEILLHHKLVPFSEVASSYCVNTLLDERRPSLQFLKKLCYLLSSRGSLSVGEAVTKRDDARRTYMNSRSTPGVVVGSLFI